MHHRTLIKLIAALILAVSCETVCTAENANIPPRPGMLQVEASQPTRTSLRSAGQTYTCHYKISNSAKRAVEFSLFTCSFWDNWSTTSKTVLVPTGGCRANVLSEHILKPGDSCEGDLSLSVAGKPPASKDTFQLLLKPSGASSGKVTSLGSFSSNPLTIDFRK